VDPRLIGEVLSNDQKRRVEISLAQRVWADAVGIQAASRDAISHDDDVKLILSQELLGGGWKREATAAAFEPGSGAS
jgi:hypothetical protein